MRAVSVTSFQQKVYSALKLIPKGRVTTYGILAREIGCRSPRAVGQALKKNPFAPNVPCHRVISSSLSIGGYAGKSTGAKIKKKLDLLKKEGILFNKGVLINKKHLFVFKDLLH